MKRPILAVWGLLLVFIVLIINWNTNTANQYYICCWFMLYYSVHEHLLDFQLFQIFFPSRNKIFHNNETIRYLCRNCLVISSPIFILKLRRFFFPLPVPHLTLLFKSKITCIREVIYHVFIINIIVLCIFIANNIYWFLLAHDQSIFCTVTRQKIIFFSIKWEEIII